jgi:hypothetical protein
MATERICKEENVSEDS